MSYLCLAVDRPQFYEIYKHRAVLGISLLFMAIDLLGGVFSILSLVFKRKVDVLAAVAYSLVVVSPNGLSPPLSPLDVFLADERLCPLVRAPCQFAIRTGDGWPRVGVGCDS